jgi:hypothetical protein
MELRVQGDERIRIGGPFPLCMNVERFDGRSGENFEFSFYAGSSDHSLKHAELRHKESIYAFFMSENGFDNENCQLPEWWKDSEVVWSLANKSLHTTPKDGREN